MNHRTNKGGKKAEAREVVFREGRRKAVAGGKQTQGAASALKMKRRRSIPHRGGAGEGD